jgi:hypothetical protein
LGVDAHDLPQPGLQNTRRTQGAGPLICLNSSYLSTDNPPFVWSQFRGSMRCTPCMLVQRHQDLVPVWVDPAIATCHPDSHGSQFSIIFGRETTDDDLHIAVAAPHARRVSKAVCMLPTTRSPDKKTCPNLGRYATPDRAAISLQTGPVDRLARIGRRMPALLAGSESVRVREAAGWMS